MPDDFPQFDTDDEMREWFDTANLADYPLDQALGVVVAAHVHLSVGGDEPASTGTTTGGASGTVGKVKLVSA